MLFKRRFSPKLVSICVVISSVAEKSNRGKKSNQVNSPSLPITQNATYINNIKKGSNASLLFFHM